MTVDEIQELIDAAAATSAMVKAAFDGTPAESVNKAILGDAMLASSACQYELGRLHVDAEKQPGATP